MSAGDDITKTFRTSAQGDTPVGTSDIVPVLRDPGGKLTNYSVSIIKGTLAITPAVPDGDGGQPDPRLWEAQPAVDGQLFGAACAPGDDIAKILLHTGAVQQRGRGVSASCLNSLIRAADCQTTM